MPELLRVADGIVRTRRPAATLHIADSNGHDATCLGDHNRRDATRGATTLHFSFPPECTITAARRGDVAWTLPRRGTRYLTLTAT